MFSAATAAAILAFCASSASAWVIGKEQTETHPKMSWQRCTGKGGSSCTNVNGEIVIDANWRWLHSTGGYTNCFDGNEWNKTACPDNAACTKNCAIEGSDYRGTYGITTSGNALTLKFITKGQYSTNIGSRTYLMKDASSELVRIMLRRQMLTSQTTKCSTSSETNSHSMLISASYLAVSTELCTLSLCPQRARVLQVPNTEQVGLCFHLFLDTMLRQCLGYCDAQCARDLKYIDGQANAEGWQASSSDPNAGVGKKGACWYVLYPSCFNIVR